MPDSNNSSTAVNIDYTETAVSMSEKIADYLLGQEIDPNPVIAKVISQFENKVTVFPSSCQISPELEKLGCTVYREFSSTDGYRILYKVTPNQEEVTAHAILGPGQDVQQLLFERLIERN